MGETALASVMLPAWRALKQRQLDADGILREAGLDPDKLRDPDARIPLRMGDAIWRTLLEATGDRTVVMDVISQFHPSALHALGYGWLSSSTLREAFERFQRYFGVVSSRDRMLSEEEDDMFWIWMERPPVEYRLKYGFLGMEFLAAVLTEMVRWSTAYAMSPVRVQFTHPAPDSVARFYEYFRCPVEFSQTLDRIAFPLEGIDQPLVTGNPELSKHHDQVAAAYLDRLGSSSMLDRLQRWLAKTLPGGNASLAAAAAELAVSQRSLQRKLAEEHDVTWRELVDGTRERLAISYLRDQPDLSLGEVAWLVGFSEPSNFTRAFRRWTGRAPSDFRSDSEVAAR